MLSKPWKCFLGLLPVGLGVVAMLGLKACSPTASHGQDDAPAKFVRISVDALSRAGSLMEDELRDFEASSGIKPVIVDAPVNSSERLIQYLQYLGVASDAIDVFPIDVIWAGVLDEHLVDLKRDFETEIKDFVPELASNDQIRGRLVAMPWFGDIGLLYYRKDLLEKNGFKEPPKTWAELEEMARKIQAAERASAPAGEAGKFWGYVWQGAAREGLVCNGLEWQVSEGGGTIVEREGKVSIDNPKAAAAFDRAAKWVGDISPPEVTSFTEEDGRKAFQEGRAAFMRNWTYAYPLLSAAKSPVAGKFGVTALPAGAARQASTLGGWQLAVPIYSQRRPEAIQLVKWLTSRRAQERRSRAGGFLPVRLSLLNDPKMESALPLGAAAGLAMRGAVARPATIAGGRYNELAATYTTEVHKVLMGKQPGAEAGRRVADELLELLH